ncbi:MAG: hypothetical protein ONB48_04885 [candidate division KSB1 bacterium]|nr:hypothetical protein [candidate division KSB1 bacterium]MDZ7274352.1 hypothetical protein [candidate division KSB1 bacterium]MDZ7284986.1 hypothetical protein [candidate division KSB1 bacterium]MDZ7297593.1 hypothetical protein [candidate division KSB1 bacterium]MDZ7308659.1 hypothetical protein [candidate division KSB1 bacterium]
MKTTDAEVTAGKRRLLIALARRHVQPGSGSATAFLTKRTTTMSWPDLVTILAPIKFAVVGAVASRHYMPERLTQDIDIVILAEQQSEAQARLQEAGYRFEGTLTIGGSSWRSPEGKIVDLIAVRESWWPHALAAAQNNRDAENLPILPLAYLVLMKYRAGRLQDLADISRMLGQVDESQLAEVRALFDREAPSEKEDLESIIQLGRLEYETGK